MTDAPDPTRPSGAPGPPDDVGAGLVDPAVELVRTWLRSADASQGREERRASEQFRALTGDPRSVAFTMSFADRVLRPETAIVAAEQLRLVVDGPLPGFLSATDRVLLRMGAAVSSRLPGVVMPLARRRLRRIVGALVVDRDDPALGTHLHRLGADGYSVNANLLGELVLGHGEARRRLDAIIDLLDRDDVHYVSVKASSVTSQLNLWGWDDTLERVEASLRRLLLAAAAHTPPKFVNLDMEEYKDLRLTLEAFTRLLDEPDLRHLEAGIVLQAYLPDSFDALRDLVAWAQHRRASGGAGIKVRLVKGANLAMERVDAALHGWAEAPYATKAETDANYKRMVDWVLESERVAAVRVGVASHNLFDVAWARLLADRRGVADRVQFEMLQGMAPGIARAVRDATGDVLLYTPIVAASDFDSALAYLFRRLEENAAGENFLHHLFDLAHDTDAFAEEQARFEVAIADRWRVSATPHRHQAPTSDEARAAGGLGGDLGGGPFTNAPDTDPTDPAARARIVRALAEPPASDLPGEADVDGVDQVVAVAVEGAARWRAIPAGARRALLLRVADELAARRPALISVMAHEAGKAVGEGDVEVSEAVDFARYYAAHVPELDPRDGASFEPLGVVAVVPPWNFPVAIPAGGVLAALAAGNAVVLKPAPQTPRSALVVAEACWAAGVPGDVLQYVRCPDDVVGEHLIGHPDLDGLILTGASETAELFRTLAPATALFAETSGKNAIVVMPDADLDVAVGDLVRSAFGHAGQKCSAASLAICVGDVATSERFRRKLLDATRSLVVGPTDRPEATMGPLIGDPSPKLRRAFSEPAPGERWLLAPEPVPGAEHLWSPGILDGVRPGSWFHRTECFGPVLGLVAARDLDDALRIQNGTGFGLTGGIHTLDPAHQQAWLDRVEVGNAYVNRAITGAIVQRQPFGGWKRSVVGPGAKAGGPDYVAQLGRWGTTAAPTLGAEAPPRVAALVRSLEAGLSTADGRLLEAAVRSDAHWWTVRFAVDHDPTGLFCEANVLRYRPLPALAVRIAADARPVDVARVVAAVALVGVAADLSVDPGYPGPLGRLATRREPAPDFASRVARERHERVRLVGTDPALGAGPGVATYVDDRPPVADGRTELLRYLREQSVSRTLHRFGNLVAAP